MRSVPWSLPSWNTRDEGLARTFQYVASIEVPALNVLSLWDKSPKIIIGQIVASVPQDDYAGMYAFRPLLIAHSFVKPSSIAIL